MAINIEDYKNSVAKIKHKEHQIKVVKFLINLLQNSTYSQSDKPNIVNLISYLENTYLKEV